MNIKDIISHIKKKAIYYWSVAVVIHLLFIIITGPRIVFHGLAIKTKLTTTIVERARILPKEIIPPRETEERVTAEEVPTRILKKAPEIKERIMIKQTMKVPIHTKLPPVIKPERVDLSDKGIQRLGQKVEKLNNVIPRERARRRTEITRFMRQFKTEGYGRAIKATFTPYQLSYFEGDWNCDPSAIPNLMTEINRRTNMTAEIKPKIVAADSEELLTLGAKALFVYMTGHHNFHFTEKEVRNLRKYLLKGGSIWADNCFPGRRSRFDIAFRREMKRVMPDRDFQTVSFEHPLFKIFHLFTEIPKGMNYRNDRIEMIKIDRREAVIYTLNDYGCLWETAFDKQCRVNTELNENWQHTYGPHWQMRHFMYENLNQASINQAYQFGINIIVYLLERPR